MTKKVCGYTGKGLRVNLTTQEVKVEATFPRFKDDIGGTAIGYKVFWEEVDPKTSCYDPENKLVIAPGPCPARAPSARAVPPLRRFGLRLIRSR